VMVSKIPDPTLVNAEKMLDASAMSAERLILNVRNGVKA